MVRHHPQWEARRRTGARRERSENRAAIGAFFSYRLSTPRMCAIGRRAAAGLTTSPAYAILTARYIFRRGADARGCDPRPRSEFRTDPAHGAILEFPGGRHLTFSVATQLSTHQRVTIVGSEAGRMSDHDPVQRAPGCPTEIGSSTPALIFSAAGGQGSSNSPSAISKRCRSTPSRERSQAITPLEFPIEDALANCGVNRRFVSLGRARLVGDPLVFCN